MKKEGRLSPADVHRLPPKKRARYYAQQQQLAEQQLAEQLASQSQVVNEAAATSPTLPVPATSTATSTERAAAPILLLSPAIVPAVLSTSTTAAIPNIETAMPVSVPQLAPSTVTSAGIELTAATTTPAIALTPDTTTMSHSQATSPIPAQALPRVPDSHVGVKGSATPAPVETNSAAVATTSSDTKEQVTPSTTGSSAFVLSAAAVKIPEIPSAARHQEKPRGVSEPATHNVATSLSIDHDRRDTINNSTDTTIADSETKENDPSIATIASTALEGDIEIQNAIEGSNTEHKANHSGLDSSSKNEMTENGNRERKDLSSLNGTKKEKKQDVVDVVMKEEATSACITDAKVNGKKRKKPDTENDIEQTDLVLERKNMTETEDTDKKEEEGSAPPVLQSELQRVTAQHESAEIDLSALEKEMRREERRLRKERKKKKREKIRQELLAQKTRDEEEEALRLQEDELERKERDMEIARRKEQRQEALKKEAEEEEVKTRQQQLLQAKQEEDERQEKQRRKEKLRLQQLLQKKQQVEEEEEEKARQEQLSQKKRDERHEDKHKERMRGDESNSIGHAKKGLKRQRSTSSSHEAASGMVDDYDDVAKKRKKKMKRKLNKERRYFEDDDDDIDDVGDDITEADVDLEAKLRRKKKRKKERKRRREELLRQEEQDDGDGDGEYKHTDDSHRREYNNNNSKNDSSNSIGHNNIKREEVRSGEPAARIKFETRDEKPLAKNETKQQQTIPKETHRDGEYDDHDDDDDVDDSEDNELDDDPVILLNKRERAVGQRLIVSLTDTIDNTGRFEALIEAYSPSTGLHLVVFDESLERCGLGFDGEQTSAAAASSASTLPTGKEEGGREGESRLRRLTALMPQVFKSLDKPLGDDAKYAHRLLHKLRRSMVTSKWIQSTGVGKKVAQLRKHVDKEVVSSAQAIIKGWKSQMKHQNERLMDYTAGLLVLPDRARTAARRKRKYVYKYTDFDGETPCVDMKRQAATPDAEVMAWPSEAHMTYVREQMMWSVWIDLNAAVKASRIRLARDESLFCVCRRPDRTVGPGGYCSDMICCSLCAEWYHFACLGHLGEDKRAELAQMERWECPFCEVWGREGDGEREAKSRKAGLKASEELPEELRMRTKHWVSHRRRPLPKVLAKQLAWGYFHKPASVDAEELSRVRDTWVFALSHLRALSGLQQREVKAKGSPAASAATQSEGGGDTDKALVSAAPQKPLSFANVLRELLMRCSFDTLPQVDLDESVRVKRLVSAQARIVAAMERKQQKTLVKHARDADENSSLVQFVGIVDPNACDTESICLRSPAGGRVTLRRDEAPPGIDLSSVALPPPPPSLPVAATNTSSSAMSLTDSNTQRKAHKHGTNERFCLQTWGMSDTCARVRPRNDADYRQSVLMRHFKRGWLRRRASVGGVGTAGGKHTTGRARRSAGVAASSSAGAGVSSPGGATNDMSGGLGSPGGPEDLNVSKVAGAQGSNYKFATSVSQTKNRAERLNSRMLDKNVGESSAKVGRKKLLRFGRSKIHAWGVFAEEQLAPNDLVVEYKGELIRNILADVREKRYSRLMIPDYMFRIDADVICDATMKGSLARFINHSCEPNCVTQVVTIQGVKKILINAKVAIAPGQELTYDYKFQIEEDKIPCNCGSKNCRGTMN